jgi:hypothetical protein
MFPPSFRPGPTATRMPLTTTDCFNGAKHHPTLLTRPAELPIPDHQSSRLAHPIAFLLGQHNRQEVALRNHTAKSSGIITISSNDVPHVPSRSRVPSRRTSVLLVSLAGVFGLGCLGGVTPSALGAEPNTLPQAFSAKIVDTASLTTSATAAPGGSPAPASAANVAPVVSMLPVPKADPATATTVAKVKKRKAKKVVPATPEAPALSQEAVALPGSKLQLSKTPDTKASDTKASDTKASDTKAPAEGTKENTSNSSLDAAFAALRKCESGGNYKIATGNGYYGAYQFDPRTWRALGYSGLPSDAPPEVQDEAARKLLAKAGWGQWPACSRKLGLR